MIWGYHYFWKHPVGENSKQQTSITLNLQIGWILFIRPSENSRFHCWICNRRNEASLSPVRSGIFIVGWSANCLRLSKSPFGKMSVQLGCFGKLYGWNLKSGGTWQQKSLTFHGEARKNAVDYPLVIWHTCRNCRNGSSTMFVCFFLVFSEILSVIGPNVCTKFFVVGRWLNSGENSPIDPVPPMSH